MAAITKKETRLKLRFVVNTDPSFHAGDYRGRGPIPR